MIVNDAKIEPMTVVIGAAVYPENIIEELAKDHNIITIDAGKLALELGNAKVLNTIVLGLAAKHIGFTEVQWLETLKNTVPPKTIEINTKAFKAGYEG
jgi:indolepyruvate ferredoxin oxidoreductase beta subunit